MQKDCNNDKTNTFLYLTMAVINLCLSTVSLNTSLSLVWESLVIILEQIQKYDASIR